MSQAQLPQGFRTAGVHCGVKADPTILDLSLFVSDVPAVAAGVFTQNKVCGAPVKVSRPRVPRQTARAVVINSGNSNACTGDRGIEDAKWMTAEVAKLLNCPAEDVLVCSTGVIGRFLPKDVLATGFPKVVAALAPTTEAFVNAARGIMTTDTVHKIAEATVAGSTARVVGVAKGVGMIEPNMATLITLIFTDAEISSRDLDAMFRRVIDTTFNCVSVDTDTSTSDTAIVLASGAAGPVDHAALESALHAVALSLTKQVARDGEGAEKLIEVRVERARDARQAKVVAKAIVNSPLVKTAVHGADPNWGRVAMAVGKCSEFTDIDQDRVVISFGDQEVYPTQLAKQDLDALSTYMRGTDVVIRVALNTGTSSSTVWGCDLTDGYVRINADYTT